MSKTLAIRGDKDRGKEVIELLEMLGGENSLIVSGYKLSGYEPFNLYYINDNGVINYKYHSLTKDITLFTLEEFLEKYPYKVGDKVVNCYGDSLTIKSMGWLEDLETMVYTFEESNIVLAAEDIGFAYDNTKPTNETITLTPDITADVTDKNNCGIQCPVGYEFYDENGNLIGTKVMMRPKKSVYPKTVGECFKLLGTDFSIDGESYKAKQMAKFYRLIVCRDAYWKIAGEEIGLNKSWEPDWDSGRPVYCISVSRNTVGKGKWYTDNKILAFPTEEMRDAFYENFKDLIESCKELL